MLSANWQILACLGYTLLWEHKYDLRDAKKLMESWWVKCAAEAFESIHIVMHFLPMETSLHFCKCSAFIMHKFYSICLDGTSHKLGQSLTFILPEKKKNHCLGAGNFFPKQSLQQLWPCCLSKLIINHISELNTSEKQNNICLIKYRGEDTR